MKSIRAAAADPAKALALIAKQFAGADFFEGSGKADTFIFTHLTETGSTLTKSMFGENILYNQANGHLSYDANGGSHADAKLFAVLDDHLALTYKDFTII